MNCKYQGLWDKNIKIESIPRFLWYKAINGCTFLIIINKITQYADSNFVLKSLNTAIVLSQPIKIKNKNTFVIYSPMSPPSLDKFYIIAQKYWSDIEKILIYQSIKP